MSYFSTSFSLNVEIKEGVDYTSEDTAKVATLLEVCKIQIDALFGEKFKTNIEYK